jgi:uncharacterized protein YndB with AHSA1/START domain
VNTDLQSARLGALDRSGANPRLRYERRIGHPPEVVWQALSVPQRLGAWFPTTIEGALEIDAPLRFAFPSELAIPPMEGRVLAVEPPKLLELQWGPDTVRFELHAEATGTQLVLIVVLETLGKAARDGAGWHVCLEQLAASLDGEGTGGDTSTRWREVHPGYVASFGPEAAVEGPPQEWEDAYGEG